MSPAPQCTRFIQLNVLFWIVTLATAVVVWVNLRIPLLSNHVFFVAFISIAWNVLGWTSESLSSLIMFALLLSSPSPGMSLVTWTTSSVVKHRAAILGMVLGTLKTWQNLCMFESLCKSPELLWDKVPSALLKGKEKKNVESVQGCWCVTVRVCRPLCWTSTSRSWWKGWRPKCSVLTTPPTPCRSSSTSSPIVSVCVGGCAGVWVWGKPFAEYGCGYVCLHVVGHVSASDITWLIAGMCVGCCAVKWFY